MIPPAYSEVCAVPDVLARAVTLTGEREAVVFPERRSTYAELGEGATLVARGLAALGVEAGDHVGVLMPNCLEYVHVLFGATALGAVVVPLNARYRAEELAYVVADADLRVLLTSDLVADHVDLPGRLAEALPSLSAVTAPPPVGTAGLALPEAPLLRSVVNLGTGDTRPWLTSMRTFEALAATVPPSAVGAARARVRVRDTALMLYTSGTTANPKGCRLSHEAIVRNGRQTGRTRFELTERDRFWDPLPLFHVGGILPLIATFDAGATFLCMTHLDPGEGLAMIARERATWLFPAFPTVTNALLDHPRFPVAALDSVRMVMSVGTPAQLRRLQEALPEATQISCYGSTETGGVVVYHRPSHTAEQRATTCGTPLRGVEVRIVDPAGTEPLEAGSPGEIQIRGYCLLDGYHKDPEKSAGSTAAGGWFRTGDLGAVDGAGHLLYQGRLKDMLKIGGENMAAAELEAFLAKHPAVTLAQVVGVPDPHLEEVAAAFIELRPSASATEEDILEFCRGRIASFKVPRYVRFVTEWPTSATKVQKFKLRAELLAELGEPG